MRASDLVVPADTTHRQRRAADPAASAWVSANAGAGKTKVLTDRVIRLLLAGAPPSRILCLTFTRAAAAEMTIRVFKTLGDWVTMPAPKLAGSLETLTGERPDRVALATARRLFARAVETPGGLKIETIHAFCERVLHLMPFEANVPARFAVLDESQTAELLAGARARILTEAASGRARSEPLARALETVALYAPGDLTAIVDGAVLDERVPGAADECRLAVARLRSALGIEPGESSSAVRRAMLEGGIPASEWPALAAELRRTSRPTDAERAASLEVAAGPGSIEKRLAAYLSVFFTDTNGPRKAIATKGVDAAVCAVLSAEQERLVVLAEALAAVETVERTEALFVLAGAVRREAEAQKQRLGALDFADLIRKMLRLLEREDAAAWVLYKLDRGIDHVLVDEAQDTNPDQWQILKRLTEEFTAGAGRPVGAPRTVFAVGDPKQSIYSFQGADPRWFEDGRRHWQRRTQDAELRFEDVRLDLSFRSARAILTAVDATFGIPSHAKGLAFDVDAATISHQSARPKAHGQVEIWPTVVKEASEGEPEAWDLPVDEPERNSAPVVLAETIARAVRAWTTAGDGEGRVWRPGDILILVRSRGPAFFAVIRALKAAGVRVAGADRFDVGDHIAVNDLVAAGQAALLPGNDLVLAAALKSPLVGLDDDDLIRIAAGRGDDESLADALERCGAAGDERAASGLAALEGWRVLARRFGPFGFYAHLLGPGGARRRLVERLGSEAADAIDAFLNYAQTAERTADTPSLTTFLARFESADHTIKRDLEAGIDEVRVMTVHGAKGLEAPLVVVIDGCETSGKEPLLVTVPVGPNGDPLPVWSPGRKADCRAVAEARERGRALRLEEHNRLLYVAMTRARDRLVVAPFVTRGKEPPDAWCAMIRAGFAAASHALVLVETPYPAEIWREAGETAARDDETTIPEILEAPDWLFRDVEPEPEPVPLRPSGAMPGAALGGGDDRGAEARRRGTLVHALLEHIADLPEDARGPAARAFLAARAHGLPEPDRQTIAEAAFAVIGHPALAALFGPRSRSEVPVVGRVDLPGGASMVSGQVDRLAVTDAAVLVADFKTGCAPAGDHVPDVYLAQLALYGAVLGAAYPGRAIRTYLVWTAGPDIVEVPAHDLAAALAHGPATLPRESTR